MASLDFDLIFRVITAPNSAFSQIRDNEEKYFGQSVGLLIIASILGGFVVLPFVMMPLDEAYFEFEEAQEFDDSFPLEGNAIGLSIGSSLLTGVLSAVLYYFIGKKLDGNTNWKKVFAVVFHTNAIVIPVTVVIAILLFFMWNSFTSIDPSLILDPNLEDENFPPLLSSFIGYVILLAVFGVGFAIWILIVIIKAIKVVHGFGTGKAFGLILLVGIITSFVSIPFSIG